MISPPHLFGPSREVACIQLFHLLLVVQVHIFCISPYRYCAALFTETDSLIINRLMSQSCPRQVLDHTESFTRVLFKIIVIVIVIVMISWSHLTLSPLLASK